MLNNLEKPKVHYYNLSTMEALLRDRGLFDKTEPRALVHTQDGKILDVRIVSLETGGLGVSLSENGEVKQENIIVLPYDNILDVTEIE